jgi:RimJ/RimL family protein N-acetyltransferase
MDFDTYHLRLLNKDDAPVFFRLIDQNRDRLEFFSGTVSKTKTLEETKSYMNDVMERIEKRQYFPFVIIDTRTNDLAGFIDIKSIDWIIPKAELGYFIDEKYQGQGVSTKALALIVRYCFDTLGINKLLVRTHEANTASVRLVVKNGFQLEGRVRKDYKTISGEIVDLVYYGLTKEDVPPLRSD